MARKYPRKRLGYPRNKRGQSRRGGLRLFLNVLVLIALILAAALVYRRQTRPDHQPPDQPRAGVPLEVAAADSFTGRVVRVGDGDTLTVSYGEEGREVKIRLYGLDAPELDQPHGKEAREFLSNLILGREVRVDKQDLDQYGRVVGLVFDSRLLINLTLVASGQAWVYEKYCREPICRQMRAEEAKARQERRGLWERDEPRPPWKWRRP